MTPNTFNVHFILKKDKMDKEHYVPIYAKITINGQRIELSINRKIKPRNWLYDTIGKFKEVANICYLFFFKTVLS